MVHSAIWLRALYLVSGILSALLCHSDFFKNSPEGPLGFYIQLLLLGFPSSILPYLGFSAISDLTGGLGKNTLLSILQTLSILIFGYIQWFYIFPYFFRKLNFSVNLEKLNSMRNLGTIVMMIILCGFIINAVFGIIIGLKG